MSTNSDDHTLAKHNDYQEIEVDYADPDSPTQMDPQTSVTSAVADIDRTAVHNMDDIVQTSGLQPQGTAPTPSIPNNEAAIITKQSPTPTSAEPRTTRRRSSRGSNDSASKDIDSTQPENLKRR